MWVCAMFVGSVLFIPKAHIDFKQVSLRNEGCKLHKILPGFDCITGGHEI